MDFIDKIFVFNIVCTLVTTTYVIASMMLTKAPPSELTTGLLVFDWVAMIMTNPFWKGIWKKE